MGASGGHLPAERRQQLLAVDGMHLVPVTTLQPRQGVGELSLGDIAQSLIVGRRISRRMGFIRQSPNRSRRGSLPCP